MDRDLGQHMLIEKLPRGTIAARLCCIDLMNRVSEQPYCSDLELNRVTVLVVRYLLDTDMRVKPEELTTYQQSIDRIYG